MAGPARHAGITDVLLLLRVDVARHLQHAARDDLWIFLVRFELVGVIAIMASFYRRHPGRQRLHQARKLRGAQIV